MALPSGWTGADFSAWLDPILADCAAERVEWVWAHTPVELRTNMSEYLATGTTASPLPTAWTVAEFNAWAAVLVADADAEYIEDVYSKVPAYLRAPVQDYISADPPAKQWSDAVIANGGTVSPARKAIVQNFIAAEIAAGTWALTDDYWCLWAENSQQALTSIKQRRLATAVASPTFLPNRHYEFNGTSQYIDTGFVPSSHAVAMTGTSLHIAVYERTNLASTSYAAGAYTNATSSLLVGPRRAAGQMDVSLNGLGAGPGGDVLADSRGLSAGSRNGTLITDVLAYRNGVAVVPYAVPAVGSTLSAAKLYIGCFSSSNTAASFRASTLGFVSVGAGLTPAQALAQFNNIQDWAIAVGAAAVGQDDVTLWANAVIGNGGTVSTTRRAQVTNLIDALKSAGSWPLIDDLWLLTAENQPQALTSLKQRRLATAVASPTFTVDRGYAFNGTTQYIDTLFTPSVNAVAMTGTNLHIAAYERTNIASAGTAAGCLNSSTQIVQINPRANATNLLSVSLNSQALGPGGDVQADSRGLSVGSRNGTLAADVLAYKNGVTVLPATPGTLGSTLPTPKIYIGARADATNVATAFRAATEGFVSVGAAIPAAQQPAFYNAIQSHMTAIGAQVNSDPDVAAWASSVLANGGTVSTARLDLLITLVKAWKAAGIWSLIDDCWLLVAENSQSALTSLKQRRLAVAVNAPVFTIDRGYAFNGTTQYIDTLFTPSVNKVAMTGTNMHIAAYERTNVTGSNGAAAGCLNFSSQGLAIHPRSSTPFAALWLRLNSQSNGPGGDSIPDSRGFWVGSRNGTLAADVLGYRNAVSVVPYTPGTLGSALATVKIYIGCYSDNTNVATQFRPCTEGFVSVGANIPASLQPTFYNTLQNFMTSVGAQV